MTPPDDEDRGAILARRAAFITSTLSLIHCSPPADRTVDRAVDVTPTATATPAPAASSASPSAVSTAAPAADRTFDDAIAKAPPRGAPAGLPGDLGAQALALEEALGSAYAEARALWDVRPATCNPVDATCKAAWKDAGAALAHLRERARGLDVTGSCNRWSSDIATLRRRRMDHFAFLIGLADEIDARLARRARAGGEALVREWEALSAEANAVPPMPCLRCLPPPRLVLATQIPFEAGSSTLAGSEPGLAALLTEVKARQGDAVEILGHADPKEPGDLQALAKKRAEAVVTWLKGKGIPASRLKPLGIGALLPQANDPAENRRVEASFLVVR